MGTVLSISPATKKAMDADVVDKGDKSLKRPSMFVSLSWKKLVASSAKKSAKKVTPNPNPPCVQVAQRNSENTRKTLQTEERKQRAPIPVPVPTVPTQKPPAAVVQKQGSSPSVVSPRRIVIQASTGELLRCLGDFVCRRCYKLKELNSGEVILWFRNIDRTLLLQGWQDQGFITPANVVFVYLLCEATLEESVASPAELQGAFQTCLYLAYSYMGNEISYPLKPFMIEANKDVFWETSLGIIDRLSGKMLQLNADPHFFTEVFQELKSQRDCNEASLDR
ncbi:cyclin-dependent kinase 5 activator 2b [Corythoichthys intestinalis]|uniref:cyclin-dependent kinase 5 activator 2b n=1 Tax=Corythoichthys intestinalis TaxID=161448 RepID=UPI0025A4D4B9|nr:cyclin-dependent kinase 5 activator 2b [Corythoichthys intestinalis]XP_061799570.1 cyclin-dependent kinase 5 activator 2-like [Nerophis lumbriciformis]